MKSVNRISSKWAFMAIWVLLVFMLFSIYAYSQAQAVERVSGFIASKNIPPGSIMTENDFIKADDIVVSDKRLSSILKNKDDAIGKIAAIGFVSGEPITSDKLTTQRERAVEFTIPTTLGNVPHPLNNLKIVDIWIDYNPREYPGNKPEKIAEKIAVKRIVNRKTLSIEESDDKIPVGIVIETTDLTIARIRDIQRKGTIFFTNPFPEEVN